MLGDFTRALFGRIARHGRLVTRRPPALPVLADLLTGEVGGVLLVFARLGAALMVVPGFGEHYVLPRLRLLLALALSLLVAPALAGRLPPLPEEPLALAALVAPEILVGPAPGLRRPAGAGRGPCRRLPDRDAVRPVGGRPVRPQRGDARHPARHLPHRGGAHHPVRGRLPPPAAARGGRELRAPSRSRPPIDLAAAGELLVGLSGSAIATGARIAAPMILAGVLVNLGLGALGRMVPSLPVLFVALPLQLLLALVILELSLPAACACSARR